MMLWCWILGVDDVLICIFIVIFYVIFFNCKKFLFLIFYDEWEM